MLNCKEINFISASQNKCSDCSRLGGINAIDHYGSSQEGRVLLEGQKLTVKSCAAGNEGYTWPEIVTSHELREIG